MPIGVDGAVWLRLQKRFPNASGSSKTACCIFISYQVLLRSCQACMMGKVATMSQTAVFLHKLALSRCRFISIIGEQKML